MSGAGRALPQRGLRVLLQATLSIRLPARRQPRNRPQAGKRMGELLRMGSPVGPRPWPSRRSVEMRLRRAVRGPFQKWACDNPAKLDSSQELISGARVRWSIVANPALVAEFHQKWWFSATTPISPFTRTCATLLIFCARAVRRETGQLKESE